MSEERFAAIETKIDALRGEMHDMGNTLRGEMQDLGNTLRVEMQSAGDRLRDDLGRQMRVLHEDVIDNIKALAPDFAPIRREFKAADDQLHEEFDRRLTPVEAALRKRQ